MPTDNKAIYASRGIHSILRVLYFPLPCVQADKSTAGLKPRPGAYSRDVICQFKNQRVLSLVDFELEDEVLRAVFLKKRVLKISPFKSLDVNIVKISFSNDYHRSTTWQSSDKKIFKTIAFFFFKKHLYL